MMKLNEFLRMLLQRLKLNQTQSDGRPLSHRPQEALKAMLRKIGQTQEVELTCGEVFDLLDQYAEMASNSENVTQLMPLVKQHLEMCADCREEFEALLKVLQSSPAL
jgi:hypothetical protein